MAGRWIDIIAESELGPGDSHFVDIDELTVALFNLDGEFFAVEDACSHDGSRMLSCGVEAKFTVHGDRLMCPRHGARFCIRSGEALTRPARTPIATFPTRVEDGQIQVFCEP